MGGEKCCPLVCTIWLMGSPPRGRGKVFFKALCETAFGITPAWAGKRFRFSLSSLYVWDHPRVGGEKCAQHDDIDTVGGSPPRGRGKAFIKMGAGLAAGITPAWAGKRRKASLSSGRYGGSPPRGRGKAFGRCGPRTPSRITPAWAGKSFGLVIKFLRHGDHPRVGGEKIPDRVVELYSRGSPPRGRGKGVFPCLAVLHSGITPAWAGKRLKRSHRSGIFISGPIPFHSVLHRPAGSGGSRAGRDGSPAGQPQNAGPA